MSLPPDSDGTTTPCSWDPGLFSNPDEAETAATVCEHCPLADACLLDALRLDAAYRRGEDPYGITGLCGGVWFEPDTMPRRPRELATRHAA